MIINWRSDDPDHAWCETTDNGYIRNHDPGGNSLYGVDIAVRPSWRNKGVARLMYRARFNLVKKLNLERFMAGGRMPAYHLYKDKISPEEYVQQVFQNKIIDPILTPEFRVGLKPIRVIHDYLPDEESDNCALLLEWSNPNKVKKT